MHTVLSYPLFTNNCLFQFYLNIYQMYLVIVYEVTQLLFSIRKTSMRYIAHQDSRYIIQTDSMRYIAHQHSSLFHWLDISCMYFSLSISELLFLFILLLMLEYTSLKQHPIIGFIDFNKPYNVV
jgi:hypothetical protein